jgi:hypothetical protein
VQVDQLKHLAGGVGVEGGASGTAHEMKHFNSIQETPDEAVEQIDDIGGPGSHTTYPWGWAQCGNSPFRWYRTLTHEGGGHVPMVMHWPAGLGDDQVAVLRVRGNLALIVEREGVWWKVVTKHLPE